MDFGNLWPTKFKAIVQQFHDGMLAQVPNEGEVSDQMDGVKQGSSMMLSVMLAGAFQDDDNGIPISYPFDGKLFN